MSDAVLQAIRKRLDAVAGGSWSMQYTEAEHEHSGTPYFVALGPFRKDKNDAVNDARFLSHVVGDVAVLLEEVEHLIAERDTLRQQNTRLRLKLDEVPVDAIYIVTHGLYQALGRNTSDAPNDALDRILVWLEKQTVPSDKGSYQRKDVAATE